jgi:hypothetical protein
MPHFLASRVGVTPNEILHEQWNIFRSLSQGRNRDWKDIQPLEEILAKGSGRDGGLQVTIGCRDQANVYLDRMIAAHTLEFSLLQHPQERDLRFHCEFADLVQEERPALSGFKPPQTPLQCASECSLFMPEKFGRDQRLRNRRAVDADEGAGSRVSISYAALARSVPCPCRFRPE